MKPLDFPDTRVPPRKHPPYHPTAPPTDTRLRAGAPRPSPLTLDNPAVKSHPDVLPPGGRPAPVSAADAKQIALLTEIRDLLAQLNRRMRELGSGDYAEERARGPRGGGVTD